MVKNDEGNTLKDNILNNLHKDVEDMINRKMELSLEKIQAIYNDELRKELESKTKLSTSYRNDRKYWSQSRST